ARGGRSRRDRRAAGGGGREGRRPRAGRGAGRDREGAGAARGPGGPGPLRPRPHLPALAPALLVLAALAAYPTAYLVRLALSQWTPEAPVPVFLGPGHLWRALTDDVFFWKSVGLTLAYTALALAAELSLGLALALLLVGHPRPGPSYRSDEPDGVLLPWLRTA